MNFDVSEILETIKMSALENLDVRTVTAGINLFDCTTGSIDSTAKKIREKILNKASQIVPAAEKIAKKYGVKIVNKRVSLTPLSLVLAGDYGVEELIKAAQIIDEAGKEIGIDFIGGYSALVHKGITPFESVFIDSIPHVLASTERLCSSVNGTCCKKSC